MQGQIPESLDRFCYLGSVQDSNRTSGPDILRRLGVATSSMSTFSRVWSQKRLSLKTKLCIYQTCILSIVLYGLEAWMLLSKDFKRLQAFYMQCQRRILGVVWKDIVCNTTVVEATSLPQVRDIISTRRAAHFCHVVRLGEQTPSHPALRFAADVRYRSPPSASWKRPRGRCRDTWLKPLMLSGASIQCNETGVVQRGHGQMASGLLLDTRLWLWMIDIPYMANGQHTIGCL